MSTAGGALAVGGPGGTPAEDSWWPSAKVFTAPFDGTLDHQTHLSGGALYYPSHDINELGGSVLLPGDVSGDGEPDLVAIDHTRGLGDVGAFLLPGPLQDRGALTVEADAIPIAWPGPWRGTACAPDLCLATGVAFGPVGSGVQPDVTWSVVQPSGDIHVAAADLDGDGTRELLLWDPRTSSLHRLGPLAPGDIDPATLATASYSPGAGTVSALETGWDWTGDGTEDLALAWEGAVHVLTGPDLDVVATLPLPATALAGGDFDGDGADDLAVGTGATVEIHLGPLPGTVAAVWIGREHPTDAFGAALDAADLDGDGREDLAVGAPQHGMGNEYFPQPNGRLYLLWGGAL